MSGLYIIDCDEKQADALKKWFPGDLCEGFSRERGELYVHLEDNQVWGLERDHGITAHPYHTRFRCG